MTDNTKAIICGMNYLYHDEEYPDNFFEGGIGRLIEIYSANDEYVVILQYSKKEDVGNFKFLWKGTKGEFLRYWTLVKKD